MSNGSIIISIPTCNMKTLRARIEFEGGQFETTLAIEAERTVKFVLKGIERLLVALGYEYDEENRKWFKGPDKVELVLEDYEQILL